MMRVLMFALTLFLIGCSKTEIVEEVVSTSWSDDYKQAGFLEMQYKQVTSIDNVFSTDYKYRIGIYDRNTKSRSYVTNYFEAPTPRLGLGSPNKELHFKSEYGYFLVRTGHSGEFLKDGKYFTYENEYSIYDVEGLFVRNISKTPDGYCNETIDTSTPTIRAMPSPSGGLIAVIETTNRCELDVVVYQNDEFFTELYRQTVFGDGVAAVFWVNEDNLLLNECSSVFCEDGWILVRTGQSISISYDTFQSLCLYGVKVSGEINEYGEKIEWESLKEEPRFVNVNDYRGTELEWRSFADEDPRLPDNPSGCINVEEIWK